MESKSDEALRRLVSFFAQQQFPGQIADPNRSKIKIKLEKNHISYLVGDFCFF